MSGFDVEARGRAEMDNPKQILIELAEAVEEMRAEAVKNEIWYSFISCEFAERIDLKLSQCQEIGN